MLGDAAAHLMEAGGKRFRPTLVLLAAQFGNTSAILASFRPRSRWN